MYLKPEKGSHWIWLHPKWLLFVDPSPLFQPQTPLSREKKEKKRKKKKRNQAACTYLSYSLLIQTHNDVLTRGMLKLAKKRAAMQAKSCVVLCVKKVVIKYLSTGAVLSPSLGPPIQQCINGQRMFSIAQKWAKKKRQRGRVSTMGSGHRQGLATFTPVWDITNCMTLDTSRLQLPSCGNLRNTYWQ